MDPPSTFAANSSALKHSVKIDLSPMQNALENNHNTKLLPHIAARNSSPTLHSLLNVNHIAFNRPVPSVAGAAAASSPDDREQLFTFTERPRTRGFLAKFHRNQASKRNQ